MTDETKTARAGMTGPMRILLWASLAFNIAVVGFVAGAFLRADDMRNSGARGPGLGAFGAPYVLALPREDRRAMRAALVRESPGAIPSRAERRAMFADVVGTLRATPFDAQALREQVSRQAALSAAIQGRTQEAWLEIVAGMDDAQRRAYADRVEEILTRGPGRR